MTVCTIGDLFNLVRKHPTQEIVLLSDAEWEQLSEHIQPFQVVPATAERPAFFWYRDKRIVTPAYYMAEGTRRAP